MLFNNFCSLKMPEFSLQIHEMRFSYSSHKVSLQLQVFSFVTDNILK